MRLDNPRRARFVAAQAERAGTWLGVALFLVLVSCAQTGEESSTREMASAPDVIGSMATAFVGVNVIPMDSERLLSDQTVVVRNGRIVSLGPSDEVEVPEGVERIDGAGKFLMPGLAEMHGHLPNPQMPPEVTENVLFLYVANGITLVRGMQGNDSQIELRERVRSGELVGPRLILGSPSMTGNRVESVEQAVSLVAEYKASGFDLLKVHEGLSAEVYAAIAEAAAEHEMGFGGHVTDQVGLLAALEVRQTTVDHLDNFVEALIPEEAKSEMAALSGIATRLDSVDRSLIPGLVEATKASGTAVVPTMVLWESGLFPTESSETLRAERTEIQYMPTSMVDRWAEAVDTRREQMGDTTRGVGEIRREIFRALHQGGATILLGTDSPQIFSVPGFSLHREMALYVELGMSPYEVLASGTRAVADHFDALEEFGTVEVGKRADLLLLNQNPLDDLAHVADRAGVMVAGRWISEGAIQERLAAIAEYNRAQTE